MTISTQRTTVILALTRSVEAVRQELCSNVILNLRRVIDGHLVLTVENLSDAEVVDMTTRIMAAKTVIEKAKDFDKELYFDSFLTRLRDARPMLDEEQRAISSAWGNNSFDATKVSRLMQRIFEYSQAEIDAPLPPLNLPHAASAT